MISLDANPGLDRQLSPSGPVLLWRDRAGGGREGLLLVFEVCPFPGCPVRHGEVRAYRVDQHLRAVEVREEGVFTWHDGACAVRPRSAFLAALDMDTGRIDDLDPTSDRAALEWFARELEGELFANLRGQFERARRKADAGTVQEWAQRRARIGRNQPCPCGSGRKYKACCLDAERKTASGLYRS
jgi:hypothetical protein